MSILVILHGDEDLRPMFNKLSLHIHSNSFLSECINDRNGLINDRSELERLRLRKSDLQRYSKSVFSESEN